MGSKLYDATAAIQVIGCSIINPSLLDDNGIYFFNDYDFVSDTHRVVFNAAYNLRHMGTEVLNVRVIEDYLHDGHPESYGIYQATNGSQWINEAIENADLANFDYNYNRLKRCTLFREYSKAGVDYSWLYDPDNVLDIKKKEQQEEYLNTLTLSQIADLIDNRIEAVRDVCVDNIDISMANLADGVDDLFDRLLETPDIGAPFQDPTFNAITRGARLGKYYLRSAPTGLGKSRMMIADMLTISCTEKYNINTARWESMGEAWPALFISTELDKEELQMMAIAFLSGINEQDIRQGIINRSDPRIAKALEVLKSGKLYIEILPDFTVKDVENTIKRNIRIHGVQYIAFDYINSSLGLITEISQRTRGVNMREDSILFLLSTRLKELAIEFNVFIESATQLNASFKTDPIPDANLLRGAKSIADKIDVGCILLAVTEADREFLDSCAEKGYPVGQVNTKLSVYKNRSGEFVRGYLWLAFDKGTCRYQTIMASDWEYNLLPSVVGFEIQQGGTL